MNFFSALIVYVIGSGRPYAFKASNHKSGLINHFNEVIVMLRVTTFNSLTLKIKNTKSLSFPLYCRRPLLRYESKQKLILI